MIILAVYFRFISREWLYLQLVYLGLNVASVLAIIIVPESPKYHYSKGRYDDARKGLAFIARFNGVDKSNYCFDTEQGDLKDSLINSDFKLEHAKQSKN